MKRKNKQSNKIKDFLFDDCAICDATKAAAASGRSLSLPELKNAFKKAERRNATIEKIESKEEKKISKQELLKMIDQKLLATIENNVFCGHCGGGVGIVKYKIFMNDLNDTILRGTCSKCGRKVARYIETGEM